MGPVRELGYLKHDGNEVMFMIILVLAFLIPVLLLISYFSPQILGLVFWSLIWFFIGLLRMKNYTKSQYWIRWLIFIACFSAYILLYLRFFGSLYFY